MGLGHTLTILPKVDFPALLLKLLKNMEKHMPKLIKSGLRTFGIHPINANAVLKKMNSISPSKQF